MTKRKWTEGEIQELRTAIVNADREIYNVKEYKGWLEELEGLRSNVRIYEDRVKTLETHVTQLEKRLDELQNAFRLPEDDQVRIVMQITHGFEGRRAGCALSGETFRQSYREVSIDVLKTCINNTAELLFKEAVEKVIPKR